MSSHTSSSSDSTNDSSSSGSASSYASVTVPKAVNITRGRKNNNKKLLRKNKPSPSVPVDILESDSQIGPKVTNNISHRFFIPNNYKVIIPKPGQKMYDPPVNCITLHIPILEAGLRIPIAEPIANIVRHLGVTPSQLVPNSIRNIIGFVIIMKYFEVAPSFAHFVELFKANTSTRSGDRGFFYVNARSSRKFLDHLPSSAGSWKSKWFYLEAPPDQPWNVPRSWRFSKPSLTSSESPTWDDTFVEDYLLEHWYDGSQLFREDILKLAGLSPARIRPKEDFDMSVQGLFVANMLRRQKEKADRENAEARKKGLMVDQPSPAPEHSSPLPRDATPVTCGVIQAAPVREVAIIDAGYCGGNDGDDNLPIDLLVGEMPVSPAKGPEPNDPKRKHVSPRIERPPKKSKGKDKGKGKGKVPSHTDSLEPATTDTNTSDLRVRRSNFTDISAYRTLTPEVLEMIRARDTELEELRLKCHHQPLNDPQQPISALLGSTGVDTYNLYKSILTDRDQALMTNINFCKLEEQTAHSLMQAAAFSHQLTVQCMMFASQRESAVASHQSLVEENTKLKDQITAATRNIDALHSDVASKDEQLSLKEALITDLQDTNSSLQQQVKQLSVDLENAKKKSFEDGLSLGEKKGEEAFRKSATFTGLLRDSRHQGVRDFMQSPVFNQLVVLKAAEESVSYFKKCEAQVRHLGGFREGFDVAQLDLTKTEALEDYPYVEMPDTSQDEFAFALADASI